MFGMSLIVSASCGCAKLWIGICIFCSPVSVVIITVNDGETVVCELCVVDVVGGDIVDVGGDVDVGGGDVIVGVAAVIDDDVVVIVDVAVIVVADVESVGRGDDGIIEEGVDSLNLKIVNGGEVLVVCSCCVICGD
jgi:hypothetical protein